MDIILSPSNLKIGCNYSGSRVHGSGVHGSRLESDEDWTVWRYWSLAIGTRIDSLRADQTKPWTVNLEPDNLMGTYLPTNSKMFTSRPDEHVLPFVDSSTISRHMKCAGQQTLNREPLNLTTWVVTIGWINIISRLRYFISYHVLFAL